MLKYTLCDVVPTVAGKSLRVFEILRNALYEATSTGTGCKSSKREIDGKYFGRVKISIPTNTNKESCKA